MDEVTDIAVLMQQRSLADLRIVDRVGQRFRPQMLQQGDDGDAITYRITQSDPWGHLGGASGECQTRIQFDCSSQSQLAAIYLSELLKDLWNGFTGELGVDGQVSVSDCTLDNEWDIVEPVIPGSDVHNYVRKSDYVVTHTTPVPTLTVVTPEVEE